jgi:uncharacterized protein (TIGR00645 family)
MEVPARVAEGREHTLMWYVIIHLTFVLSAVMMGVLDRITGHKAKSTT